MRIGSSNIGHAEFVDEELGKFVDPRQQRLNIGDKCMVAGGNRSFFIMLANHRHARGRWNANCLGIAKDFDEVANDRDGFAMIAGIPMHLAAAGLVGREIDRVAEALEHADYCLACLRKQGVVVAGNEQRHAHDHDLPEFLECTWRKGEVQSPNENLFLNRNLVGLQRLETTLARYQDLAH